jgi:hypothetical protein
LKERDRLADQDINERITCKLISKVWDVPMLAWIRMSNSIFWYRPSLFWDVTRDKLLVGKGKGTVHPITGYEGPEGE